MKNKSRIRAVVLAGVVFISQRARPCTFAIGYFHQITNLSGTIVGMHRGWPRWIRQHVTRDHVDLRLHEFRWPVHGINEMPIVKTASADKNGWFDFGPLPEGHYTLEINESTEYGDLFDVEIKKLPKPTSWVKIDVTPVYPDCTGGHEFIVYN